MEYGSKFNTETSTSSPWHNSSNGAGNCPFVKIPFLECPSGDISPSVKTMSNLTEGRCGNKATWEQSATALTNCRQVRMKKHLSNAIEVAIFITEKESKLSRNENWSFYICLPEKYGAEIVYILFWQSTQTVKSGHL